MPGTIHNLFGGSGRARDLRYAVAVTAAVALGMPMMQSVRAQTASFPDFKLPSATEPDTDKVFSMDDFKTAFKNKQYQDILDQIAKIQADPKLMANYKTHGLTIFKAEAELRLLQPVASASDFALAAKSAADAHAAAMDTALAALVKRSVDGVYTPKHPPQQDDKDGTAVVVSQTYDITNMDQRKDALAALYNDVMFETKPKVIAAEKAGSLTPIVALIKPLNVLDAIEIAATDEEAYVTAAHGMLCTHAVELTKTALGQMDNRINAIKRDANTMVEQDTVQYNINGRNNVQRNYYKRGLSDGDIDNLDQIISDTNRIAPTADQLVSGMQQDEKLFANVVTEANKVNTAAVNALNTNYSGRR